MESLPLSREHLNMEECLLDTTQKLSRITSLQNFDLTELEFENLDETELTFLLMVFCAGDLLEEKFSDEIVSAVIKHLVDCGASATIGDHTGVSPLVSCLLQENRIKEVELLLQRGASPNQHLLKWNGEERSCLAVAIETRQVEYAKKLLEYGADMEATVDGLSMLWFVMRETPNNQDMMQALIDAGANVLARRDHSLYLTDVLFIFAASTERHSNPDNCGARMKASRASMQTAILLMKRGCPPPRTHALVELLFLDCYGALIEYMLGCIQNQLEMRLPTKADFEAYEPDPDEPDEWTNGECLFPEGKLILLTLLHRTTLCQTEAVGQWLMDVQEEISDDYVVPRLVDMCIARLRKHLLDRYGADCIRLQENCEVLPLAPRLVEMITLADVRKKFEKEIKEIENSTAGTVGS